ncbi:Blp family class II bacteriocin [Streptococcus cristatus]|uniref:Blp family class II bacteriocin n=1 Tax=Streptococcus cristatus TaxID=45634 RepID=UPI00078173B0|nr:Blp family class II bacteriocin [Streptococcus cristatus]
MENFAMMDNQFAALTEEEMMMIDGGWSFYGFPVDIFTVSLAILGGSLVSGFLVGLFS